MAIKMTRQIFCLNLWFVYMQILAGLILNIFSYFPTIWLVSKLVTVIRNTAFRSHSIIIIMFPDMK